MTSRHHDICDPDSCATNSLTGAVGAALGERPTPVWIRLPKVGSACPFTGLSRSTLNSLILPTAENNHRPPVKSICLRRKHAQRGCRLISFESLTNYLASLQPENDGEKEVSQ
jgi:hypothetical protein